MQFFEIRKDRPIIGLADVAKKIISDSLPIKCLEAVILSIYLINETTPSANVNGGVEKFCIGFKTVSKGNIHRHVVLGVYCHATGLFGALGLSRRSDLGHKPVKFKTLTDLISSYIECYSVYLHRVKRIKIGMPIPISNRSFETIPWNGCTVNLNQQGTVNEWSKLVEKQSKNIRYSNNNLNLAQSNPLSFKNLTNLAISTPSRSYSKQHLDKDNASCRLRSKSHDNGNLLSLSIKNQKLAQDENEINFSLDDGQTNDEEDENEYFSNNISSNIANTPMSGESMHKNILRRKSILDNNIKGDKKLKNSSPPLKNLSPQSLLNCKDTGILAKRKKKSLRV